MKSIKRYIDQIIWAFSVPVTSLLGSLKLKKICEAKFRPQWKEGFAGKKVLIVGTGPSIDKIDESYFSGFEVILYINYAVKFRQSNSINYYFSTDVKVSDDIFNSSYKDELKKIDKSHRILAPIFFQQVLNISYEMSGFFTWLYSESTFWKVHYMRKKIFNIIHVPCTFYKWPRQPQKNELDEWLLENAQLCKFPIIESTSALSAILFAAKGRPSQINLIGCDFSSGRAEILKKDNLEHKINRFSQSRNIFNKIKLLLQSNNINVINDSWNV